MLTIVYLDISIGCHVPSKNNIFVKHFLTMSLHGWKTCTIICSYSTQFILIEIANTVASFKSGDKEINVIMLFVSITAQLYSRALNPVR